jgi:hypothetical protein
MGISTENPSYISIAYLFNTVNIRLKLYLFIGLAIYRLFRYSIGIKIYGKRAYKTRGRER